jgi:protein-S-isoprenylcysteine O-methyltransferase Ste14
MPSETFFRILLPVLVLGFAIHRGYYVKNHSMPEDATLKKREEGWASKIAGLLGMAGCIAMLLYVFAPEWLSFARLSFPLWVRVTGIGLAIAGISLLQWAQVTLGRSWSDTPRMMKEQSLITSGPYRSIRHPIYTSFLLILGSTLFISSNWLIGLCWAGMTTLEILSRIQFEESILIEYFGDQYRNYMKRTGRLLPKIT